MRDCHQRGLIFESAVLFAIGFKLVQSSWVRNKTLQSFYLENMVIGCERGPCDLFPKTETKQAFGHDCKELAGFMLTPTSFGTKKNNDDCQLTGTHRHELVENCNWFLACATAFCSTYVGAREKCDFCVSKGEDPSSKSNVKSSDCQILIFH